MIEMVDLSKKIDKSQYKEIVPELQIKLGELQREARAYEIPIIIIFEGWDAAGKGTLINRLILTLDPRGFTVYPINPPNEEERLRPFLWRFWTKTPEKGRLAIFDRSWYGRVLVERVDNIVKKDVWQNAYHEINSFEKQLVNDGTVIVKFFLHISQEEQKKRFKQLLKNPSTAWKVTKEDWKHHKQYDKYLVAIDEMLEKTDTNLTPWTIVESHDRRYAIVKVFNSVIEAIKNRISEKKNDTVHPDRITSRLKTAGQVDSILNKVDLTLSLERQDYEKQLANYQKRIQELEHEVYIKRIPVIIVYQGWDAAGKGGNIKRLVQGMDPRGYEVIPIGSPNDVEKSHHYLWRFWLKIPKAGHIAIFDRSWYGRVLVERIEGFCTEDEWKRAFEEINEFEEHLTNFGTAIIKFWLHIDSEEQLKRFKDREISPHKKWKIGEEDWRNRKKWVLYEQAVDEMLVKTSTTYAPWTIIEANSKLYARIKALKTVIKEVEKLS